MKSLFEEEKQKQKENTPAFVTANRKLRKSGTILIIPPTAKRIEDRKEILRLLLKNRNNKTDMLDSVIDYMKNEYVHNHWAGLSVKERRSLFLQWKGRCYWCKEPIRYSLFTVEHITPRGEGGKDEWSNYAIAHADCNQKREGNMLDRQGFLKDTYSVEDVQQKDSFLRKIKRWITRLTNTPRGV